MTVTAPFVSESDLGQLVVDELIVDEVTIDLTEPAAATEVEASLLHDPLLPFLVSASASLIAVIVTAYFMSSGSFPF